MAQPPALSRSGSLRFKPAALSAGSQPHLLPHSNVAPAPHPIPHLQSHSSECFLAAGSPRLLAPENLPAAERLWALMSSYLGTEPDDIQQYIVNHLEYTLARSRFSTLKPFEEKLILTDYDAFSSYQATAYSVRDRLIEFWNDTQQHFHEVDCKRIYYLSIEYLMGRTLQNAVINLGLRDQYSEALKNLGMKLEELYELEQDAALGNGGLGRLASCFMDSLATLNYPAWGYGIRYNYGMFRQEIHAGEQAELPESWLSRGNPWEIERNDISYHVRFGGRATCVADVKGGLKYGWEGGEAVLAVAYDIPVPGYRTYNTLNMRMWSSRPSVAFDLESFNRGDYWHHLARKQAAETITSVLYPNDATDAGKELRLKQQYFFCAATLADIIRRFKKNHRSFVPAFAEKVAIQLNDTHPTISTVELMRLLVDEEGLPWDDAWGATTKVFAYTNHTVLPEALEKWALPLLERLLPRHVQIILEINARFLAQVHASHPHANLAALSIIEESRPKCVRMAHLAIVCSHSVNGVAAIHTEILKQSVFRDFVELWPERFNNKTNGVTPRRWIAAANPGLTALISAKLGSDAWLTDMSLTRRLSSFADDTAFLEKLMAVKAANKERLRQLILRVTNGHVDVSPAALFDVQVKRIHEYKRQLLNILGVMARYRRLARMSPEERQAVVPRVFLFGGKAAPGYQRAKQIIKLINSVADTVNSDPQVSPYLKVVFLANYNVSLAEVIIPASDLSEHISTAGTEASGTSNMKFAMNGGLIIGTLDGANVEMRQEIGAANMFVFGATAGEVDKLRAIGPRSIDERLYEVLLAVQQGAFGPGEQFESLLGPLWLGNDFYLLAHDFASYLDAQERVERAYANKLQWAKMCLASVACMGHFSSDRTIHEYAREIWHAAPCATPTAQAIAASSPNLPARSPKVPRGT